MLRNVSINLKGALLLTLPTVTIIALLVPLVLIGNSLDTTLSRTERLQGVATRLDTILSTLLTIHSENLQYALLSTSEMTFELQKRKAVAEDELNALAEEIELTDQPREDVVSFMAQSRVMLDRMLETHRELREADGLDGGRASAADDERSLRTVSSLGDEIRRGVRERTLARFAETEGLANQGRVVLVSGSIAAMAIVMAVGWLLLRSMLWRLHTIQENVARMEQNEDLLPPVHATDEIGRIDAAAHKMVNTLRAQNAENEMFIYSVSHDLRSPLVNLQGFGKELHHSTEELGALLRDADVPDELRERVSRIVDEDMHEALRFIDSAVQRQARIIDSLLALSRAGRVEYRWQSVETDDLLRTLAAELEKQVPDGRITIVGELPAVHGDPDALERLFENVLGNAIKYRDPARPARITVSAAPNPPARTCTICVRDNGVGMTPEQAERAFMPFSRYSSLDGEGIGLSLVKRVASRHHGDVTIESEAGVGTTVFVNLPEARPSTAEA